MASYYFSGQGSLYAAERNTTTGAPLGFIPLGNIPSLELSVEVTKFEHKESETGQRAIDLTIIQEKKGTFSMTMEDINMDNLAMAWWGEYASTVAGTDSGAAANYTAHLGYRMPLAHPNVDTVVVGDDAVPTITYEFGTSATDAASKNGYIDAVNGSLFVFTAADQTSKGAANSITEGQQLFVSYNYGGYTQMDAFTKTSMERYLRFEGLNTIDDKTVIVEIFKASFDPLAGFALINEELGSFDLSGSILYDGLQSGTSKYFKQIYVS